jgi:transcriptional regulator with XRE-family HTH domain
MTKKRRKASNASRILARITGREPAVREAIETHKLNASVAEMILAARKKAGLTQGQLARLVGTTESVISRLEDADYEGHSLTMLRRIAEALDHRVEVQLVAAIKAADTRSKRRLSKDDARRVVAEILVRDTMDDARVEFGRLSVSAYGAPEHRTWLVYPKPADRVGASLVFAVCPTTGKVLFRGTVGE